MNLYRIKDWDKLFENSRSRAVESLHWVAIPNRHDGEHYTMIITHPDGAMIYAAWQLITQVASKCQPRGSLVKANGTPHTPASLSLKTRAPEKWFIKALEFITSNTDWLETQVFTDEKHPAITQPSPSHQASAEEEKGMEGNGKEENRTETRVDIRQSKFDVFWSWYPRKEGKGVAEKAFERALKKTNLEAIGTAIDTQKQSAQWLKDGGQFIPHPATWLNQERWLDEPPTTGGITAEQHAQSEF